MWHQKPGMGPMDMAPWDARAIQKNPNSNLYIDGIVSNSPTGQPYYPEHRSLPYILTTGALLSSLALGLVGCKSTPIEEETKPPAVEQPAPVEEEKEEVVLDNPTQYNSNTSTIPKKITIGEEAGFYVDVTDGDEFNYVNILLKQNEEVKSEIELKKNNGLYEAIHKYTEGQIEVGTYEGVLTTSDSNGNLTEFVLGNIVVEKPVVEDVNPVKSINDLIKEIYDTAEINNEMVSFVSNLIEYNNLERDSQVLLRTYSSLESVIKVVESNPSVVKDFTSTQSHVFANLVSEIPGIAEYPKAMREGTIAITSQNLADEYAMEKFAIPAIEYIIRLQDEGKIDALNGLGIPDAALESEGIRQILLPIELREVNIVTGVRTTANLETGIYNVTLDESLDKSPQEWLGEISVRDYNDKNLIVWKWIKEYPTEYGPRGPWSNSAKVYAEYLKSVDDLVLFIRDYPIYLMNEESGKLIPKLTGQIAPYYSVLVGREFGEAVFDVKAKYPTDPNGKFIHSEAFILSSNTSDNWLLPYLFGFWPEKQAFIDDYKNKPNDVPHAEVRHANGTYKVINFDQNLTQQNK